MSRRAMFLVPLCVLVALAAFLAAHPGGAPPPAMTAGDAPSRSVVGEGRNHATHSGAVDGDAAGFARARAWFERLGYPDLSRLPFVRVWTGDYWSTTKRGKEHVEPLPQLGWLIAEDGDRFRVFTTELRVVRFRRLETPSRPEARVSFDRIDLAATVHEGLAALGRLAEFEKQKNPPTERPSPLWKEVDPFGDTAGIPPLQFKGFVLACACAQAGREDAALALWRRLAGRKPWPPKESWSILDDLGSAIGHEARRNLTLDLGYQDGTWDEHLAAQRRWLERFPGHAETGEVRSGLAALERTGRTETVRREDPRRVWGEMSDAERANDLVERLSEPFAFLIDPIDGRTLARGSAIAVPPTEQWVLPKLIGLGDAAVPRLIEALGDDRWTRSVSQPLSVGIAWREEFYVERVADLALVALGAITGEDFSEQHRIGQRAFVRGPRESIVTRGGAADAQARARAWWSGRTEEVRPGK